MANKVVFDLPELGIEMAQSDSKRGRFQVRYGKQLRSDMGYVAAAKELGECILHSLACEGRINNEGDA